MTAERSLTLLRTLYPEDALWDNLMVLGLPLNEGAGDIAYDISGLGNHATLKGTTKPQWVAGQHGGNYALEFDGANSYAEIKSAVNPPRKLVFNNALFTIEIAFKPDAGYLSTDPDGNLFDHYKLVNDKGYYIEFETDSGGSGLQKVEFATADGVGNQSYVFSDSYNNRLGIWDVLCCIMSGSAGSWRRGVSIKGAVSQAGFDAALVATAVPLSGYGGGVDSDSLPQGASNLYYPPADAVKLAGIEANATTDQTGQEIRDALVALGPTDRRVLITNPGSGQHKVTGVRRNGDGRWEYDYDDVAES